MDEWLMERYSVNSANSMIAALNQYLVFVEMGRLRLKRIRIQRTDIQYLERSLERAEYLKMVEMARRDKKEQIAMIMRRCAPPGSGSANCASSGWKIYSAGS